MSSAQPLSPPGSEPTGVPLPPPLRPPLSGLMIGLLLVEVVATGAYWGIWFFGDRSLLASANTESYFVFENAFPVADGWMSLCAALAAFALWTRRESALLWLIAAGSATLYLAAMDILFDLQNGIYLAPLGDWGGVVVEAVINLFTLGFGAWAIAFAWRHRAVFRGWGVAEGGMRSGAVQR